MVRSQHWVPGLAILTFGLFTSQMLAVAQSAAPPKWENDTFTKFRRDEGNPNPGAPRRRENSASIVRVWSTRVGLQRLRWRMTN